ncbi:Protein Wnt [Trichuris trichiura]|uniref:Protein Wnt n=1 Tax=Trichuris trichiura TaxID=36087 RepID=A0A077ZB41_TRITR|nr:Protein Wnt [Trichuris trichiura]
MFEGSSKLAFVCLYLLLMDVSSGSGSRLNNGSIIYNGAVNEIFDHRPPRGQRYSFNIGKYRRCFQTCRRQLVSEQFVPKSSSAPQLAARRCCSKAFGAFTLFVIQMDSIDLCREKRAAKLQDKTDLPFRPDRRLRAAAICLPEVKALSWRLADCSGKPERLANQLRNL